MALRGVKPQQIQKRLKAFFYGPAKVGKTTAAIQFPKVYLIDTERGAENDKYVRMLEKGGGVIFQTNDFEELIKEVKSLLTEKHEYKTLVIDPLTTLYNDLVEKAGVKHGTDFGRHYNEANKRIKHLYNLLLRLDMNVIITSHAKNEYGPNMAVLGQTFDCYKKLDYMFDLILEIQKRGKDRVAVIKGTRLDGFKEDEVFPFDYDEMAERYGRDVLERDTVAEVLANADQCAHLRYLIDLYKEPSEVVDKWLTKANADSFEEMNETIINKLITHMEDKAKLKGAA